MAASYDSRVLSVQRCEDFLALRLSKPQGYRFAAGQWLRVSVDTPGGMETRTLSFADSPSEDSLDIGTRLSPSAFKQALAGLEPGAVVRVSAAGGRPKLSTAADIVYLAGGVGITPARSYIRDAIARGLSQQGSILFYGNRDEACIPYADELVEWQAAGLEIVHVLESVAQGSTAEQGFITSDVIARHTTVAEKDFFVAGPPIMVVAMERVLDELGVGAERRHIEAFGTSPVPDVSAQSPA